MITLWDHGLVYWTGILTGIFFVSAFLGCRCFFNSKLCQAGMFNFFKGEHSLLVHLAFFFFLAHLTLAVLGGNFGIWL